MWKEHLSSILQATSIGIHSETIFRSFSWSRTWSNDAQTGGRVHCASWLCAEQIVYCTVRYRTTACWGLLRPHYFSCFLPTSVIILEMKYNFRPNVQHISSSRDYMASHPRRRKLSYLLHYRRAGHSLVCGESGSLKFIWNLKITLSRK